MKKKMMNLSLVIELHNENEILQKAIDIIETRQEIQRDEIDRDIDIKLNKTIVDDYEFAKKVLLKTKGINRALSEDYLKEILNKDT